MIVPSGPAARTEPTTMAPAPRDNATSASLRAPFLITTPLLQRSVRPDLSHPPLGVWWIASYLLRRKTGDSCRLRRPDHAGHAESAVERAVVGHRRARGQRERDRSTRLGPR